MAQSFFVFRIRPTLTSRRDAQGKIMAGYRVWRRIGLWLIGAFAIGALPAKALAAANPFPLSLTCYGEVDVHRIGNQPVSEDAYQGYVEVRLSESDTRIQLPRGFRPKADDTGWYRIK